MLYQHSNVTALCSIQRFRFDLKAKLDASHVPRTRMGTATTRRILVGRESVRLDRDQLGDAYVG